MPEKIVTADQFWVRNKNRSVILEVLMANQTLSRARLANLTGLNPSTVSSIINDLLSDGLVVETDLHYSGPGRPGRLLELNPSGGCAIGIEYNVDYLAMILADITARVIWRRKVDITEGDGQDEILRKIIALIEEGKARSIEAGLKPVGIGMGIAGIVDVIKGEIRFSPSLEAVQVPIRSLLADRFNLPIHIENDANAAALGEYYFGTDKKLDNLIYLSCSRGLGGGIIINGRLFRGSRGFAGEIGHMTIDPQGEVCKCGKQGCWETVATPKAAVQHVVRSIKQGSRSIISDLAKGSLPGITFENIVTAADAGDQVALTALRRLGESLSLGIINIVNAFDTDLIVLGGTLHLASRYVIPVIQNELQKNSLEPFRDTVRVSASVHGSDACLMGAVALVVDNLLSELVI
ncbi:MAG: hypothetical protein A2Z16_06465 [Chloroflexi bacterium RBG_16_54_18]|nr:MAG: hypothetical protein A2Z16_06465 [Chloroflexi bacterium RBG_16_54_18]